MDPALQPFRRARSWCSRFAFTLAFAELAHLADLAPIIGAFVAGLALARTSSADRIRGELAPIGHLLVPVFFLQIGIDADIQAMADWKVLGIAAALLVIAVLGKLAGRRRSASGVRATGCSSGIGMIPRGEVGLIFATLGLREGRVRTGRLRRAHPRRAGHDRRNTTAAQSASPADPCETTRARPGRDRRDFGFTGLRRQSRPCDDRGRAAAVAGARRRARGRPTL